MAVKVLLMIKKVEIINKREFILVVLNINNKIFIIYIVSFENLTVIPIYPFC